MAEILVVDDVADNLKVLRNIFAGEGYSIRVATNGLMALKSATAQPPDLILMDINMPYMNGIEACTKLKENPATSSIPIIFVTANTELDMVVNGLQAGGVDYITKPFRQEEIVARVHTHINLVKTRQRYANAEVMSAIGHMVVGVSHELNTPLGVCVTSISSLKDDLASFKEHTENNTLTRTCLADYLYRSAGSIALIESNCSTIVDKLNRFKAITLDQIENKPRTINLSEYMHECIKLVRSTLVGNDIQVSLDCEDAEIITTPGHLFHIISNLVSNSVSHAYGQGVSGSKQICFQVFIKDDQLNLAYWDNGVGVTPTVLKQILRPFYTTKLGDSKHLGLSASVINGIVTIALHGSLTLDSDSRGLVYDIRFPITLQTDMG